MIKIRMSKSAVLTYLQCPFRYYLEYIKRVPRRVVPEQLKRGSEIHSMADKFYDTDEKSITGAIEIIKKHPNYEKYKEPVKNFIKRNKEIISEGKDVLIKPVYKELKLHDKELNIKGIIDAIQKDDKMTVLTDYKTGKLHDITKFRFELALYTYLYEKQYNDKVTHWEVYFIDHDKSKIEKRSQEEIDKALATVLEVRSLIKNEKFGKKPSWLCSYCSCFKNGYCKGNLKDA